MSDELERAIAVLSGTDTPNSDGMAVHGTLGAAVPADVSRDSLSDYDGQLIMELVANLRPRRDILLRYHLTENDIVAKARNPEWASRFREISTIWNSDKNFKERIRAKAAFLLEDSLVHVYKIITSSGSTAQAKLAAVEQLTKISTVANTPKEEGSVSGGTRISIHFGGAAPVTLSAEKDNERVVATVDPRSA